MFSTDERCIGNADGRPTNINISWRDWYPRLTITRPALGKYTPCCWKAGHCFITQNDLANCVGDIVTETKLRSIEDEKTSQEEMHLFTYQLNLQQLTYSITRVNSRYRWIDCCQYGDVRRKSMEKQWTPLYVLKIPNTFLGRAVGVRRMLYSSNNGSGYILLLYLEVGIRP